MRKKCVFHWHWLVTHRATGWKQGVKHNALYTPSIYFQSQSKHRLSSLKSLTYGIQRLFFLQCLQIQIVMFDWASPVWWIDRLACDKKEAEKKTFIHIHIMLHVARTTASYRYTHTHTLVSSYSPISLSFILASFFFSYFSSIHTVIFKSFQLSFSLCFFSFRFFYTKKQQQQPSERESHTQIKCTCLLHTQTIHYYRYVHIYTLEDVHLIRKK